MVRIHACHAWGREFEPRRSRQFREGRLRKHLPFFVLERATPVASYTRAKLTFVCLAEERIFFSFLILFLFSIYLFLVWMITLPYWGVETSLQVS